MEREKTYDGSITCNFIKSQRKNNKKNKYKCITIPLLEVDGVKISAYTNITIRATTSHVNITNALKVKGKYFCPTTNKKLSCYDSHALEQVEKQRDYKRKNYKAKGITIPILDEGGYTLSSHVFIMNNIKTGNISFCHPLVVNGYRIYPTKRKHLPVCKNPESG